MTAAMEDFEPVEYIIGLPKLPSPYPKSTPILFLPLLATIKSGRLFLLTSRISMKLGEASVSTYDLCLEKSLFK